MRWWALAGMIGCQQPVYDGPKARFDDESSLPYSYPFPSNHYREVGGTVDFSSFPNPQNLPILDDFVALASTAEGFSPNAPIYFTFDGPLDEEKIPNAQESTMEGAAIFLIDVDSRSPHWGERFPIQYEFATEQTTYQPQYLLAVAPIFGIPLRPATTYALVITTSIAAPSDGFDKVWRSSHPDHDVYAPLQETLFFLGLQESDVAVATVFTTSDPVRQMADITAFLHERVDIPVLSSEVERIRSNSFYQVFEAHYPSPIFQHGERPYREKGGGFQFDENGLPKIADWDRMRLAICTPLDLSNPPEGGWPVVINQHGTGGDYISHCNSNSALEVASQLSKVGLVSLSIDQPLHGPRGTPETNTELDTFNYLNPESAASTQRQGALDAIYLARALAEQEVVFTTEDGQPIPLNTQNISFFGHSQGGTTGAIAIPFFGDNVHSALISGAGGGMSLTLIDRKDPVDIAALIEGATSFVEGEHLTPLHPIASIIQNLVDVTDPLNYGPYWFAEQGDWDYTGPVSVVLTNGLLDAQTPHRAAEALAASAYLPQLAPQINQPAAIQLRGIEPVVAPVAGNEQYWNGEPITSAFSQWPENDHFAVFTNKHAARMYRMFLRSAADGEAIIPESDE